MLQIRCPWCGVRDEEEFRFGGEAHVARPEGEDEAQWASYLFVRQNPKGRHFERWCHRDGCGRWLHVVRDTVTHEILHVYRPDEPQPVLDAQR